MEIKTRGTGYTHKTGNLHATRPAIGLNYNGTFSSLDDYQMETTWCHKIEGFHKRVREGVLLPHMPFMQLRVSQLKHVAAYEKFRTYSSSDIERAWGDGWVGELPSTTNVPTSLELLSLCNTKNPEQFIANAIAALYSRNWDGLTFAAELSKTISLFRKTFSNLYNIARALLTTGPAFAMRFVDLAAKMPGKYLEYRYAWRTLVFDCFSILKAIEDMKEADRSVYTERKGSSFSIVDVKSTAIGVVGEYNARFDRTLSASLSLRGNVSTKFRPATMTANPFVTAWELIPFSFIVDWFIGVGTALQAISGAAVMSERTTSWGGLITGTISGSNTAPVKTSGRWDTITLTSSLDGYFEYAVRVPADPSYIPRLQLKLDAFKITDLLAIFYQLTRK